ncbi:MAG: hypothetical protein HXY49_03815 [Ignavibacteriaceae bacterium]|nr:hypothetical protein [Ignavibacteriaceae bacterium]
MNKKKEATCKEVMHHICESLGENLNSEKCSAIKAHLEKCSGCQNYFKTVELTIDFYKKYQVELPPDAHTKLMTFLDLNE